MGPEFDLQMKSSMTTGEGETVTLDPGPVIELKLYEIWKHADADNDLVTPDKVGTRKEGVDPTLLEKIWFNAEGTEAYSDQIYTTSTDGSKTYTNILVNNVICAKNFWYNTSLSESRTIVVNGVNVSLETETFYWNIGTITEDELVLSYFVYLTGSMQGERNEEGSYDTNEYATLTYSNYLGHSCEQSVPTPVLPWNQATVGYGFYLVNKDGQPIINQTSGKTGSFEQAVRITSPVYETFALNSDSENIVASIVAEEKLPDGYTLFDKNTAYEVQLSSDGTGYCQNSDSHQTVHQHHQCGEGSGHQILRLALGQKIRREDMKKTYCKPDIYFEDFSLNTNIAAGCEKIPINFTDTCGIMWGNSFIFVQGISGCNKKIVEGKPEGNIVDEKNNALCYHNPSENFNVFNS